jgi:glycerol-3-phosphate acyltransferase PlsY
MQDILIVCLIGYLFGNIQAAYLITKYFKKADIRSFGYGNAGASNVVESFGMKFGLLVALIDISKAIFSILLIKILYSITLDSNPTLLYLNGFSVVLGHVFPFHMNFKGGKGTASLIGILFGLNFIYGFLGLFIIILGTFITDRVALGTIGLTLYWIFLTQTLKLGWMPTLISVLMFILSFYLHLPNYKRILNNTEGRLSHVLKKKAK